MSKRSGGGDSSRRSSKKKTKTEEEAPAGAPPYLTKSFDEGFWKGSKLEIHVPFRIITLTPVTVPPSWNPPFSTFLSHTTYSFGNIMNTTFPFGQRDFITCHIFVASKCFGAIYAGLGHLLEHVLVQDLRTYLPGTAVKGTTTEYSTKYEFNLTRDLLQASILRIVKTFTNVDYFSTLAFNYMRDEVHNVHQEFLERLFPLNSDRYLSYILGNKAYVHPGHHKNFCGVCNEANINEIEYRNSRQRLKDLFQQVHVPENICVFLEGPDPGLVTEAVETFRTNFIAASREPVEKTKELDYSLSGKWIRANAAFIKSYRELNLAWTIRGTDPILYEYLKTLFSCKFAKGGLVQVLGVKCANSVYKVDDVVIRHTSAVRRHFILRMSLFNNVTEKDMIQVIRVVLEFLKAFKHWLTTYSSQFEVQFDHFVSLMNVNKEFYNSQDAWERLESVATNFIYDSHNSGPALNIDTIAWKLAAPRSMRNMQRLQKLLEDEFLETTNMAIIDIKLTKDEFQKLTLEDLYLADLPLPIETEFKDNVELVQMLQGLADAKDVTIDFDANFIRSLPLAAGAYPSVPYHNWYPTFVTQVVIDPCVLIQLHLEWCTDCTDPNSSDLHPVMPDLLSEYLSYGYRPNYFSVWLAGESHGPGSLTVRIVGLKKPALDLLYSHVLPRLSKIRTMTCSEQLVVESTFLNVYKNVVQIMCLSPNWAEDLIKGMMRRNYLFYQDRLVGLDKLAKQKDNFYSYFRDVLNYRLHFSDLFVQGNLNQQEFIEMHKRVLNTLGRRCLCSLRPQRVQQSEISLEKIVLPGNKSAAVLRKRNYLRESPSQCFQRVYYLNSAILDDDVQRNLNVSFLKESFLKLCKEQRIGYAPTLEYFHDPTNPNNKRLLIFKIPFSIDVKARKRTYDSDFHSMESIRDVVEGYVKDISFKKTARQQSTDKNRIAFIASEVLPSLECRLTVEIYGHGAYARSRVTKDNAHMIEWYDANVWSADVVALEEYRKSVGI